MAKYWAFRHFLGSSHREDDQAGLRGIWGIVYNDLDILLIEAQYSKSAMNSRPLQSSSFEIEMFLDAIASLEVGLSGEEYFIEVESLPI